MNDVIEKWRNVCLNFTPDIKWLVSEVFVGPHRNIGEVMTEDQNRFTVRALWDTGSTTSIICPEITKALKLNHQGQENMQMLLGHGEVNTYFVDLFISNEIVFQKLKVTELPCRNQYFDMIIGLDIIKLGNFSITKQEDGFKMDYNVRPAVKIQKT